MPDTSRKSNLPPGDDYGADLPVHDAHMHGAGATKADMKRGHVRVNATDDIDRDEMYGPEPHPGGGFAGRPQGFAR